MKMAECLNTADISTLRKIAEHYDFPVSRHSKLALLQEISFTFRDPDFLREQIPRWYANAAVAMLRLALETRTVFSTEELEGMFSTHGEHADRKIEQASTEGWLFPTRRLGGRQMYCIPDELHRALRTHMADMFMSGLRTSVEGPLTFQEEEHAMARDLDVMLEYIRHHEVRLTTDGSMYKRNLQQLLALLEVPEEPLAGGWRFGYGRRFHDYPDRLALLYDFAFAQQFIDERDDGWLVVTDACQAWTEQSPTARQRALLRFFLQLYRRPIPRLPQVVQLMAMVANNWVDAGAMLGALNSLVNEYYYDDRAQVWQVRILKMLMHLGVIRIGVDDVGCQWFQITKLGQELITPEAIPGGAEEPGESNRILIVQPNFEIVATADQAAITAQLAVCAELKQTGVVRVYRITQDAVQRAIANGQSIVDWLGFLQRHAQTPVPGNVERTLLEWARSLELAHGQDVGS